ncbi:MAG: class I SAM-dependent methyltransferase [bacterium]
MLSYTSLKEVVAEKQNEDFYGQLLGEYDQMMDWESRLQRETSLHQHLLERFHVKSILDAGCGTGRHCFHFHSLGVEKVVGVDASARVIELAKRRVMAIGSEIVFIQATFTELSEKVKGHFDLVCCLGNSISHLLIYDDLVLALKNFSHRLSGHGAVLIQCLNWERRLSLQDRFFPIQSHHTTEREKLFFRFLDFHDELITMNLSIFTKDETTMTRSWSNRISSTTLRPWRREILRMALEDAHLFVDSEYGSPELNPFHPLDSHDYIVVAKKK